MNRLIIGRSVAPHLARFFLLAPLAIAISASPARASGTTRWVDNDGLAGPGSCGGTAVAKKTIQQAINASGANDTVKVCPGTYVERVAIDGARQGLTLLSDTNHAAIIKAPAEATFNTIILVKVTNVSGVTINGFSIRPLCASSHDACDVADGIDLTSAKTATVTNNEIKPNGNGPYCGVFTGISATGGTTGTVSGNSVTDCIENGIHLGGTGTNLGVSGNTVTFAQVGLGTAGGAAILVDTAAKGSISGDTINGPASGAGNPPEPAAGVQLDGSAIGTTVSGNTITTMAVDIDLETASGGSVTNNRMTGGQTGLELGTAVGVSVSGNWSHGATVYGLYVANPSKNNNVHDNDFRTNQNVNLADCKGQTSQVVSAGSGNAFDANLGNSSSPAALCNGRVPR